jgi:membrane fusion protein, multidrug efflux system
VITTLDDIARVYVDFPVPETQLAQIGPGQAIEGLAAAYPGRSFEGRVATVDARIDPATRSLTVRGEFANPDRVLKPGMLLQVRVRRPERQALLVPEIAVVQAGSDSYVYRVSPQGTAERVDVKLGTRAGGRVEVLSGLEPGARIVVDGTGKVRPGQKVKEGGAPGQGGGPGAGRAPASRGG